MDLTGLAGYIQVFQSGFFQHAGMSAVTSPCMLLSQLYRSDVLPLVESWANFSLLLLC